MSTKQEDLVKNLEQAQNLEATKDFLGASFIYKTALELARDLGDKEAIKSCKAKLTETNQKARAQMKEVEVRQPMPPELVATIEALVKTVLGKANMDIADALRFIGLNPNFFPQSELVKKMSANKMPVMFAFTTLSTISQEGHQVEGGSDAQHHWYMKIYGVNQRLIEDQYLTRIMFELIDKGKLTEENLVQYFQQSGIVPQNSLEILKSGIAAYFRKDYIAALHILIPQFEGLFLRISKAAGIDTVTLNRGKEISTRTTTLSAEHLDSEPFVKMWTKDFCEQLKFVLFDPLGYKLRHRVAHGEVDYRECNFTSTSLILYLFLVLFASTHKQIKS